MGAWTSSDLHLLIDTIQSGGRPKGGASEDTGEIPSLGGENIRQSGGLEIASVKRVPLTFFNRLSKGVLKRGDVLINKDGANTGKLGLYEGQFPLAAINEHLFLLRGKPSKIHQRYLYYLLLSQSGQETIKAKISGSAQPGLKGDFIRNFPVKVPKETFEQLRISDVLITVDRAIEQKEALIAKYQRIKTGLVQDLLTLGIDEYGLLRDPATHRFKLSPLGRIPQSWRAPTIRELASRVGSGVTPKGGNAVYQQQGISFIRSQNVTFDGLLLDDVVYISPDMHAAMSRSEIFPCDVLLNITGASIGRCCYVPKGFGPANVNQHVCAIRLLEPRVQNAIFLAEILASYIGQSQIEQYNAGGNREGLNYTQVRSLIVPWPEPNEREDIAKNMESAKIRVECERAQLSKLRRLKTGLMQDLLTGNVPVDPLLNTQIIK
jgi:type I restriction enzyme S subunit